MTTQTTTAADAIDTSIREDRIVHLSYDADVMIDLAIQADGSADDAEGTEYWGEVDGSPWRVRVEAQ